MATPAPSSSSTEQLAAQITSAPASAYASGLSAEQQAQFEREGYLVLPDFFSAATAAQLKAHVDTLVSQVDLSNHPRTVFKTDSSGSQTQLSSAAGQQAEDKNRYFLDSADNISYFFEEQAWNADGTLAVPLSRALNKIGHALHTLDPPFGALTRRPEVSGVARSLGFQRPAVLQSMVILKQPRIGGQVVPHRDSTFLHTQPSTAAGLWFALEDCTKENGCLSFVPGSHKDGASDRRFVRKEPPARLPTVNNPLPAGASAADLSGPANVGVELTFEGEDRREYPSSDFLPTEVKAGTAILIHGDVVHASTHNHSERSRYIYTFHLIERKGADYPTSNWLQSKKHFPILGEEQ